MSSPSSKRHEGQALEGDLAACLARMFPPEDLHRFLRHHVQGTMLVLPAAARYSRIEYAAKATEVLLDHGLVDVDFFIALRQARPKRIDEIRALEVLATGMGTSPSMRGSEWSSGPSTKEMAGELPITPRPVVGRRASRSLLFAVPFSALATLAVAGGFYYSPISQATQIDVKLRNVTNIGYLGYDTATNKLIFEGIECSRPSAEDGGSEDGSGDIASTVEKHIRGSVIHVTCESNGEYAVAHIELGTFVLTAVARRIDSLTYEIYRLRVHSKDSIGLMYVHTSPLTVNGHSVESETKSTTHGAPERTRTITALQYPDSPACREPDACSSSAARTVSELHPNTSPRTTGRAHATPRIPEPDEAGVRSTTVVKREHIEGHNHGPSADEDDDGIVDKDDACPSQKENLNGYQDDDGCPDMKPIAPLISSIEALNTDPPRGPRGLFATPARLIDRGQELPYPSEAAYLGVGGTIEVELAIDERGHVVSSKLLNKLGHGLDEVAAQEARALIFEPARDKLGEPIASTFHWTRSFEASALRKARPKLDIPTPLECERKLSKTRLPWEIASSCEELWCYRYRAESRDSCFYTKDECIGSRSVAKTRAEVTSCEKM